MMGHEFGHVQQVARLGFKWNRFSDYEQHVPIYKWQLNAATENGWNQFYQRMNDIYNPYDLQPGVDILNLPLKLLNRHP